MPPLQPLELLAQCNSNSPSDSGASTDNTNNNNNNSNNSNNNNTSIHNNNNSNNDNMLKADGVLDAPVLALSDDDNSGSENLK